LASLLVKLNPIDIRFVKAKAQETGISFQAIIGALVHTCDRENQVRDLIVIENLR
jgi:predicted DNA binding CopG/RHH family protein